MNLRKFSDRLIKFKFNQVKQLKTFFFGLNVAIFYYIACIYVQYLYILYVRVNLLYVVGRVE